MREVRQCQPHMCPCCIAENRLEPVYPTIRYKLANALKSWHPSDLSAHMILEPWVDVFPPGVMEAFVSRTILPQLSYCLQLMVINPNNQDIRECCSMWCMSCDQVCRPQYVFIHPEPFKWVLAWRDMVSPAQFASMLDKAFFPKWLQVCCLRIFITTECTYVCYLLINPYWWRNWHFTLVGVFTGSFVHLSMCVF